MRKLLAASILSVMLVSGCATDPNYKPPFPDGSNVTHKLSKRKGIVTGQGMSDYIYVRFLTTESTVAGNGTVVNNQRFEDVQVRPFEIEMADPPAKAN